MGDGLSALAPARLRNVSWFAVIGASATLLYASLAWAATLALPVPAALASLLAYVAASAASYVGHRRITFRSGRPHRQAAPRFAGLAALGYAIALLAPWLLTDTLGAHPLIAIALTCIAVPVVNAVVLSRAVFGVPLFRP